jgi:hypothetical protein
MVPEHGHGAKEVAKRIREVAMNRGFVLVRLEFSTIDRSSGFGVRRRAGQRYPSPHISPAFGCNA